MTKQEFATKLKNELNTHGDADRIANRIKKTKKINGDSLSLEEQLEIVSLIHPRDYIRHDSVDAFLALVNRTEEIIKASLSNPNTKNTHKGGNN